MAENKNSFAVRLLPSLTDLAFLMPLIFLFGKLDGARTLLGDGDTGWHIRAGEWMLRTGSVPRLDLFSYTMPERSWYAWEWLADVLLALAHNAAGLAGVALAACVLIGLTFALLFRLVRFKTGNVLIAAAMTLLATAGSSLHWLARPHLFTLLFVTICLFVVERARRRSAKLLAILPALTLLWTQLHGGFFCGILILLAYGAGELARAATTPHAAERRAALARFKPYALAALGCLAATFVNPYGWRLHVHVIRYLSDKWQFTHIMEFLSISFQNPVARNYFEPMLLLGVAAAFWHLRARRFEYVFLLAGWAHLGLMSARNIPIFMIVAAPVVGMAMVEWAEVLSRAEVAAWIAAAARKVRESAASVAVIDGLPRLHAASAAAVALIALLLLAPSPPRKFKAEYDRKAYPAAALESMQRAGYTERVFTDDEWGDYLIYRLYPTRVFVDGRSDFYGSQFDQRYLDALMVKHGWDRTLADYGVRTVLLQVDCPLAGALKHDRRWRVEYDDGIAIVFRPSAAAQVPVAASRGEGRDREITKLQTNPTEEKL